MQNPAYATEETFEESGADRCAACGHELFGPDAEACSWQAWGAFWEILGMSHVELVCGSCGEYLRDFFNDRG
jgi:hypothetical protein